MGDLEAYSVAEHLNSRYLNLNLHTSWLSEENEVVVLPLWNLNGQMVGVQQYRPNGSKEPNNKWYGRYFTRVHTDNVAVWGLESWSLSNTLFVCEGLFDAAKITWLGYSAIAIFTSTPGKSVLNWLKSVKSSRPVVVICDSDNAGLKLAKCGHTHFHMKEYHDVGDAPLSYVRNLCRQFNED